MKRTLLFLVAVSAVLSLPATAAAFRGVAIAKNPARHTIVVAARGGVVRTLRVSGGGGATRLGRQLVYSARRLSDGTFRASSLRVRGRTHRTLIRGTVVRNQRRLHRLLISAGGSVFAVRSGRGFASVSDHGPAPGDEVEVSVEISDNGLVAGSVQELGHTDSMELTGIFLGTSSDGQLRLVIEYRGEVFVAVPAGFQLPTLQPGDEVELEVAVDAATGAFTLVSIQSDDQNDGDHEGIHGDNGNIEVKGAITSLSDTSITVQSNGASPVTCAIPAGTDLSAFKVTDQVEMKCVLVGTQLTLSRLKREHQGDDDGDDDGGGGDD